MRRISGALELLRAADARLDAVLIERRSLGPGRTRATSLEDIGHALLGSVAEPDALARDLVRIAEAVHRAFPGNLFWDFDFLAACLAKAEAGVRGEMTERIVALQDRFGLSSPICFRYVHDFMYGFDWARWVQKAPDSRRGVGPFDLVFLSYLDRRGGELVKLISENDAKYPRLEAGVMRNPFEFPREPEDEARLHEDLARRGLIPVEAWRFDAVPRFSEPFSDLHRERALSLG